MEETEETGTRGNQTLIDYVKKTSQGRAGTNWRSSAGLEKVIASDI